MADNLHEDKNCVFYLSVDKRGMCLRENEEEYYGLNQTHLHRLMCVDTWSTVTVLFGEVAGPIKMQPCGRKHATGRL